jgi:predicted TIM-barrel fold metal-dependent hydrolase
MRGIRVYPNYHGYKLDNPLFAKLLEKTAERRLIVQLAVMMEDARTQHPLVQMPPVDLAPLASVVSQINPLRLVLLNSFQPYSPQMISKLAATGKVYFETATLEGIGGIETLLHHLSFKYLLFGSNAPLFYFEAALLKLKESFLKEDEKKFISNENARRLIHNRLD